MKRFLLTAAFMGVGLAALYAGQTTTVSTVTEAGEIGEYSSVVRYQGKTAIAFADYNNGTLKLWIDDGYNGEGTGGIAGDGIVNGGEIRRIDNSDDVGENCHMIVHNDMLAVVYHDFDDDEVWLWVDDGNGDGTAKDGFAHEDERRQISSLTDEGGEHTSIVSYGDYLAIAFYDSHWERLRLWVDDGTVNNLKPYAAVGPNAGNYTVDGGELRSIDSSIDVGEFNSMTVIDDTLAIAYYNGNENKLRLWLDDGEDGGLAKDGQMNGGEIRFIDDGGEAASITIVNGRLAIVYWDSDDDEMRVWIDDGYNDGVNDGVAGDGVENGDEVRLIFDGLSTNPNPSAGTRNNKLVVSFYDSDPAYEDLLMWADNGDGLVTDAEIIDLDVVVGVEAGNNSDLYVHGDDIYISYHDEENWGLKLATIITTDEPVSRRRGDSTCVVANHGSSFTAWLSVFALAMLALGFKARKVKAN